MAVGATQPTLWRLRVSLSLLGHERVQEEDCEVADQVFGGVAKAGLEDLPDEQDSWLQEEHDRLRQKHGIPENAYLTADEPVGEEQSESFLESIDSGRPERYPLKTARSSWPIWTSRNWMNITFSLAYQIFPSRRSSAAFWSAP